MVRITMLSLVGSIFVSFGMPIAAQGFGVGAFWLSLIGGAPLAFGLFLMVVDQFFYRQFMKWFLQPEYYLEMYPEEDETPQNSASIGRKDNEPEGG